MKKCSLAFRLIPGSKSEPESQNLDAGEAVNTPDLNGASVGVAAPIRHSPRQADPLLKSSSLYKYS